jgi:uncharacterized protein with PIN domain
MRFAADEMLGKLARWLRVGGLDVSYERKISDSELVRRARQDGRIILTRDTHLIQRLGEAEFLFIGSDHLKEQLREFYGRFPQLRKHQQTLTRCLECNTLLEAISKEQVKDRVWPYVYKTQAKFTTCASCGRIYWEATHVQRIMDRLDELLGG